MEFKVYFITYTLIRGGLHVGESYEIEATEMDAAYKSIKGRIEPDDNLVNITITSLKEFNARHTES